MLRRVAWMLALAAVMATSVGRAEEPLEFGKRLTSEAFQEEKQQHLDKAEQLLKQVLDQFQAQLGPDHLYVAFALEGLANFKLRHGGLTEPVQLLERSVAIRTKAAPNTLETAKIEHLLGLGLSDLQRYPEAETHLRNALDIRTRLLGGDHPDVADSAAGLAGVQGAQRRFAEAEALYRSAIEIVERKLGADDPKVAAFSLQFGIVLFNEGKLGEAGEAYKKTVEILDKKPDANPAQLALALNNLAEVYVRQTHSFEAKGLLQRALAIPEKPNDPIRARTIYNLANILLNENNPGAGRPLLEQALAIYRAAPRRDDGAIASTLTQLAFADFIEKRWDHAEQLYQEALAITERISGPESLLTAQAIQRLANTYQNAQRYKDALPLHERVLAIREKQLPADNVDVRAAIASVADDFNNLGHYRLAEGYYSRALKIAEKTLPPDDPQIATYMYFVAWMYGREGRYGEAEPLSRRVLEIREKSFGPESPAVADTLNGVAALYQVQGRDREAETTYKRALAIYEKAANTPATATILGNLSGLYQRQGRTAEAEPLARRAIAIFEQTPSAQSEAFRGWSNLALILRDENRLDEAADYANRALAAVRAAKGDDSSDAANMMMRLGTVESERKNYQKAEQLLVEAVALSERASGPEHPATAEARYELSELYVRMNRRDDALAQIRKATDTYRERARRSESQRSGNGVYELQTVRRIFARHIELLADKVQAGEGSRDELISESFEVAQLVTTSGAARAVARMGERFAAGSGGLADVVRERQDALEQWAHIDSQLVAAPGSTEKALDPVTETRLRAELRELDARIKKADERLAKDFPAYLDLAAPQLVSTNSARQLLAANEALLVYFVHDAESFLWVVRKESQALHKLPIGRADLAKSVNQLRALLDPQQNPTLKAFDPALSQALYAQVLGPADGDLDGVAHLIIVPDGPLQSLPFHVLVTDAQPDAGSSAPDYRHVPWLLRKFSLSVLPSVSSIKAIRTLAQRDHGTEPFVGIGNPILEGKPGSGRGVQVASLFRGALADVTAVRQLPPLPDTADELEALARSQGASAGNLYMGDRADEGVVRSLDLSRFRVIAFATHGLVAGDLAGLSEPALVLTPPKEATVQNDGLLTASEIAQLRLNADWVILSACNTASSDGTPGADGLSGLAKAFFYAGSRTLLVSHWPVVSSAAVRLTTGALGELAKTPKIGRAEALRRSMIAYLDDTSLRPEFAHPMVWAPFVVVGEGGASR